VAVTSAFTLGLIAPSGRSAGSSAPTCHGKPATVVGTQGRDYFASFNGDFHSGDVVDMLGGNDRVADWARNVTICGAKGRDKISTAGPDVGRHTVVDGGRGLDRLARFDYPHDREAVPKLFGGAGNDRIDGSHSGSGYGQDSIRGGTGDDVIDAGEGHDFVRSGGGSDYVLGGRGGDKLYGGRGADRLFGGSRPDHGPRDDYANGGPQRDRCVANVEVHCEE
jgi:Ca2+-binding RTX toxin-like protein